MKNYILNSPTDIQECDSETYWAWHERQKQEDQTVLGIRLGYKQVGNKTISTVFCGDDTAGYVKGKPLLFETILHDPNNVESLKIRHMTHEQAMQTHCRLVDRLEESKKLTTGFQQALRDN